MPALTKDYTILASNALEAWSIPLDMHVVKAATVQVLTDDVYLMDNWIQLTITSGGTTKNNILVVLASGYAGTLAPISWTGSLPVEADMYLTAFVLGSATQQFRLSSLLWKIRLDEQGEFRADP